MLGTQFPGGHCNGPETQAAFCGIWGENKWDNVLPHCLAVEKIKPDGSARIVYAWGLAPQYGIRQSGHARLKAVIEEGVLRTRLSSGATVRYSVAGEKLRGKWQRGGRRASIMLERFER